MSKAIKRMGAEINQLIKTDFSVAVMSQPDQITLSAISRNGKACEAYVFGDEKGLIACFCAAGQPDRVVQENVTPAFIVDAMKQFVTNAHL